ncbi:hypothetical protein [Actinoplanes sp. NPDC049316]|uniref:hypothetical protein n=1 Tax=Actinoplanes sp. NPDC049316 TaxID=3154727 RepID=UPI00342A029E
MIPAAHAEDAHKLEASGAMPGRAAADQRFLDAGATGGCRRSVDAEAGGSCGHRGIATGGWLPKPVTAGG